MIKEFYKDKLRVRIYSNREKMGEAAGNAAADYIAELLEKQDEVNIVFGAAPSQDEVLAAFVSREDVDTTRINLFNMDEYIGIGSCSSRSFANYLERAVASKRRFRSVNYIDGSNHDTGHAISEYEALLMEHPIDLVFMGVGENGHIAFNDPHVALFNDPRKIKVVDMDIKCRMQQVNDGAFGSLAEVPTHAITLTIPTLFGAAKICCVVPARTKSEAVRSLLNGEVSEKCPASILRRHDNAVLYLDPESASRIL